MKIWLNDQYGPVRSPDCQVVDEYFVEPSEWTWLKTVDEVLSEIENGGVTNLHLDHDLSYTDPSHTGMDVLIYLSDHKERLVEEQKLPSVIAVHSGHMLYAQEMWRRVQDILG